MNPYFLRLLDEMGVRSPDTPRPSPVSETKPHPLGDWPKKPVGEPPH